MKLTVRIMNSKRIQKIQKTPCFHPALREKN